MKEISLNENIVSLAGGDGGLSFLVLSGEKTAIIDTGMAYCGKALVLEVEKALKGRMLDYILLTHAHYDHCSGMAFLKERWPNAITMATEYSKKVLSKAKALAFIRDLNETASMWFTNKKMKYQYLDSNLAIEEAIDENSIIDLGNSVTIEVIETPGHTKDSLTFYIPSEDALILSETTGCCLIEDDKIFPGYLISYTDTISAINKLKKINASNVLVPHGGIFREDEVNNFFDMSLRDAELGANKILEIYNKKGSEDEMLAAFSKLFRNDLLKYLQPDAAFEINTLTAIRTIIREST